MWRNLGSVCACQCVCTVCVCVWDRLTPSRPHRRRNKKKAPRAPLPPFLLLPTLWVILLNLFPHKISMLIANGLSCHGLSAVPRATKGSQNGPKTPNSLSDHTSQFCHIYIKVYYTIYKYLFSILLSCCNVKHCSQQETMAQWLLGCSIVLIF